MTVPSILVVEDDEFSRAALVALLKEFTTFEASDANQAMNVFNDNTPDIVFLDIELPDVNGQTILKDILNKKSDSFIVMVTGHKDTPNIVHAIQNGAKGYITKPYEKEKIQECLSDYYEFKEI